MTEIVQVTSESTVVVQNTDTNVVEVTAAGPAGSAGPAGPAGSAGPGIATGGTSGQFLAKASNADYDTEWLDVSGVGTVTSVAATVPTGFTVGGSPITTTGTITIDFDTGYSLPTNSEQSNWDAAYSWGNHALAGYAHAGVNSDITALSGLTGSIENPTYVQMGSGSGTPLVAGRMWYDTTTGAWNFGMGGGNITQQVGEELFVYGKASAAITDSPLQIVYQTGTVGASGVITFAPTVPGITDGERIIGVATEPLALNATGRVTAFGVIHGVTTDGVAYGETWVDNDVIWYNPVTGNPTNIKPVAPNIKVQIGTIINAGAGGSGSVQVEIMHGSVLGGTDSNVQITTPATNNLLVYNGTYWANRLLAASDITTALNGTYSGALAITGQTSLAGTTGAEALRAVTTASAVNRLQVAGAVTTASPTLSAQGADTNIDLTISSKGGGAVTAAGRLHVNAPAASVAAWANAGVAIRQAATVWTDNTTPASGGITSACMNTFGPQTYAALNPGVTINNLYGTYFQAPLAGANVTAPSRFAIMADSILCLGGLTVNGGLQLGGSGGGTHVFGTGQTSAVIAIGGTSGTGNVLFGQSTASQTTSVQAGATASGSTKTLNMGTGGLAGSTTAITLGSATGTSTSTLLGTTYLGGAVGAESLRAVPVTSSVNFAQVLGSATGGGPTLAAAGADAAVDLNLNPKGTGSAKMTVASNNIGSGLYVQNAGGTGYLRFGTGASANFYPMILGVSAVSTLATGLSLQARAGSDTDTTSAVVVINPRNNAGTTAPAATQTAFGVDNFVTRVFSVMGGTSPVAVLGAPTNTSGIGGTLRTADMSGTDISAGNLALTGGRGTGTGTGGAITFSTAPAGTTGTALNAAVERLRITAGGDVHGAAGATTMASGFLRIPSASGAPTGVPAAIAGTVPLYYDAVNDKLYVYNGAWKASTAFV